MDQNNQTDTERKVIDAQIDLLNHISGDLLRPDDMTHIQTLISQTLEEAHLPHNSFGLHPILFGLQTAQITIEETGLGRDG
ncbi:MAG: RelA/SpoT family protein, partial [Prevotella sp.]|nr:RelA/SpoT family protein [Prevotella sp.]